MTDSERIIKVIEWSKLSQNAFSVRLGYQKGQTIYNITNGSRPINIKLATKISNTFPEINKAWLLTDKGLMLTEENNQANETLIKWGNGTLEKEREEVRNLQAKYIKSLEEVAQLKEDIQKLKEELGR